MCSDVHITIFWRDSYMSYEVLSEAYCGSSRLILTPSRKALDSPIQLYLRSANARSRRGRFISSSLLLSFSLLSLSLFFLHLETLETQQQQPHSQDLTTSLPIPHPFKSLDLISRYLPKPPSIRFESSASTSTSIFQIF